jgi:hypothetical protein
MYTFDLEQLVAAIHSADCLTCVRAIREASKRPSDADRLLPVLYARKQDSNPVIACEARNGIERCGRAAVPFLLQLLHSEWACDRVQGIQTLSNLGRSRSYCNVTDQVLDDRPNAPPDWGEMRDDVLTAWRSMLNDADPEVRVWAAVELDEIGISSDVVVQSIAAGLDSPNAWVRRWCALHLGRMGPAAQFALPALRRNAGASEREDAGFAQQAILRITG